MGREAAWICSTAGSKNAQHMQVSPLGQTHALGHQNTCPHTLLIRGPDTLPTRGTARRRPQPAPLPCRPRRRRARGHPRQHSIRGGPPSSTLLQLFQSPHAMHCSSSRTLWTPWALPTARWETRHALQVEQDTLDPQGLALKQVGGTISQAHLLESGVWTSSTSLMRPPASRPSSYLVSTSSRPLLSASAWPLANSRSARADACAKHAPCCHPTLCAVLCWRWSQVRNGAADRAGPAPRMPTLALHPGLTTSVLLNGHADRVVGESEGCCQVEPRVFRSVASNRHDHALGPCQVLGRQPQR